VSSSASNDSPDTSRRAFLRRFAGTATVAAAAPLPAAAVSGDLYVNHRIGLAFRKPPTWRYEHLRTFADIRNEYEYATPDPALAAELKQGQLPVVVVSQAAILPVPQLSMSRRTLWNQAKHLRLLRVTSFAASVHSSKTSVS